MLQNPERLQLTISDLHPSGNGIGHVPGFGHIYVPFAFPGDQLEVRLKEEIRPGKWKAERLTAIAEHCAVAGRCGGCIWPGAPYAEQLEWKKTLLLRAAKALPAIISLPVTIHGNAATTGFRNRVHLHANFFHGDLEFGFYGRGSRALVPVADCPVAEEPIRRVLRALAAQKKGGWPPSEDFGFGIEFIHLAAENSKILMILYSSPERRAALRQAAPRFAALDAQLLVREAFSDTGEIFVWQQCGDAVMFTRPGAFQQGNRAQSDVIRRLIGEQIVAQRPQVLFDLYSGSGNYSLPHYQKVGKIFGCDDNRVGIEVAAINVGRNRVPNATYVCGDSGEILQSRESYGWPQHADFVVVDPARYGMSSQVIEELSLIRPQTIFYISNNTVSFVRDAKALLAAGFKPERLNLVDFFPNTPHLNIVSVWHNSV